MINKNRISHIGLVDENDILETVKENRSIPAYLTTQFYKTNQKLFTM